MTLSRQELEEWKRTTERRPENPPAPLPPDQEKLLALQAGVGNAALSRALLARDLPSVIPQLKPPEPMPAAIAMRVVPYLERMRLAIQLHNTEGTISMPEVVNMVRQNVPEALACTPFQIELQITETLGSDTPPAARKQQSADGRSAQMEASILNSLPKPPKELKLYAGSGSLAFSISGEATLKAGPVTAKVDKDGADVTVKEGDASVGAKGSFAGDSFGLKASIKGATFDAQLKRDETTKQFSKFTANVKIPIAGGETVEARPPVEDVTETVMKAQAALAEVAQYLHDGGSPTDEFVKTKMGEIKPALSKVSAAVEERKGPQATLKFSVGTGDPKLGTYGTVSLVIEF
jgi:hypothetical protein